MKITQSRNKREGKFIGYWGGKWIRLDEATIRRINYFLGRVSGLQGGAPVIWSRK